MRARPRLLWAVGALSAACALALAPLVATSSLAGNHALWVELDLVIGGGFTAVGLFTWYRRPDSPLGALMIATAFAWYLLVASHTEPSLLWTVGAFTNHLFVATVIHLLLAFPSGRLGSTGDRVLVEVSDDGVGGADRAAGSGLRGLLDRVAALGGELEVHSPAGEGTTVRAAIPYDGAER
jgi:hypothetical protein